MNTRSRTLNTLVNIFASVGTQMILFLLSFISRTIFIQQLGVEYLGINGLYTNILTVLSLADLGMGTAMAYTLYKPIGSKDYEVLSTLITFFKQIYRILASVILIIGLLFIPFLKYVVTADIELSTLKLYYLLFLANSISSYFVIYKATLLDADQRTYIIKLYHFLFDFMKIFIQIIILIYTKNFFAFLIIQLISTILTNLFISRKADKLYPFLKEKALPIKKETKIIIWGHVKDVFLYKIGGVILNSTDNIMISVLLGTIWVGYYSNYSLLIGAVIIICGLFFNSFVNSVGNLNAVDPEKSLAIFKAINFLNFWIYGFSSIAIYILIDDFIYLWLGNEFILNKLVVVAAVFNVYIYGMLEGVANFRNTTILFKKTKYVFLITAFLNIVLSVVLGIRFGLVGVLFATAISRLLTSFWYEPLMLHRLIFKQNSKEYFIKQFIYVFIILLLVFPIVNILDNYVINVTYTTFTLKTTLIIIFVNIIFFLLFRKSQEFILLKDKIFNLFKSQLSKR